MYSEATAETLAANPYAAAVVLVVVGIILLLAMKDRRYALFGYLFFLPMAVMPIMGGRLGGIPVLSVQNLIMALGLYAVFLTRSHRTRMDRNLRIAFILYWIVVVVAVLRSLFHLDEMAHLNFILDFGIYSYLRGYLITPLLAWLAFVIAYRYAAAGPARATEYLRYAAIAILGYAILLLGSAAYYYAQFSDYKLVRAKIHLFLGVHSNDFSFAFAMVAPILIAGIVSRKAVTQRDRILFWPVLGAVVAAVLFSYSRTGYVALALAVFSFALFTKRSLLLLFVPVLVGLILFGPASVTERVQFGFESAGSHRSSTDWEAVSAGRLPMGRAAVEIFTSDIGQMAFGGGRLTFPRNTFTQFGVDTPHNAYLEALLDVGVVGFIPVIALFLLLLSRVITGIRRLRTSEFRLFYVAAAISLGCFLMLAVSGRSFFPSHQLSFVWQILGFALGLLRYDMSRASQRAQSATGAESPRILNDISQRTRTSTGNSPKCAV